MSVWAATGNELSEGTRNDESRGEKANWDDQSCSALRSKQALPLKAGQSKRAPIARTDLTLAKRWDHGTATPDLRIASKVLYASTSGTLSRRMELLTPTQGHPEPKPTHDASVKRLGVPTYHEHNPKTSQAKKCPEKHPNHQLKQKGSNGSPASN